MTVTTHIAEILRQGVWASLTGGWYYEPSHTMFCNTFHLYLWMVLLVVPLVVGLVSAGEFSLIVVAAYISFIFVLFTILKVIVSHLHVVFDTSEPVIMSRTPHETSTALGIAEQPSGEPRAEDSDMIELTVFNRGCESGAARQPDSTVPTSAATTATGRRRPGARVEFRPEPLPIEETGPEIAYQHLPLDSFDGMDFQNDYRMDPMFRNHDPPEGLFRMLEELEESDEEGDKSTSCLEADTSVTIETGCQQQTTGANPESKQLLECTVTEILPTEVHRRTPRSGMMRKLSEPVVSVEPWPNENRRGSSDCVTDSRVRRANSTFEPRRQMELGMLSQTSLEKARKNTNKSYPSKMSSDDGFPDSTLTKKSTIDCPPTLFIPNQSEMSDLEVCTDQEVAQFTQEQREKDATVHEFGPQNPDEPCCSTADSRPRVLTRPGTPIDPPQPYEEDGSIEMPSTSSSAWIPVVVSLKDMDRRTPAKTHSISLAREDQSQKVSSDGPTNIKGEITKFLEDLIDKHPETLDAIESVRMSRLGRTPMRGHTAVHRIHNDSGRRAPSSAVSTLSEMAVRDGTHVASGHEDTTQGALHSFQDEEGNWWTYAFDEQGVGTAQPLGSGPALMEMIKRERSSDPVTGKTVLDVLPESTYASSEEDADVALPVVAAHHGGPAPLATNRRERALSSSSNESYTYIPSVPTSVFHAASRTGVSRSARQMVSFVNVASRLRSAVRQPAEDRTRQGELDQIMDLLDRGRSSGAGNVERRRVLQARMQEMQERMFRLDSVDSALSSSSRRPFQDYQVLGLGSVFGGNDPIPTLFDLPNSLDFSGPTRRPSVVKKSYYYQMKMFPKTDKTIKLKLDRLSVAALFDRNRGFFSCVFDICLASLVSLLAALVLSTGIYFDLSLVFFAFVVAGAHFSLLKSVQPDASSPIHGFNWLVVYSRPVYFSCLCTLLLVIDYLADDPENRRIPWNWNLYRMGEATSSNVIVAVRDVIASCILFLPVAFTLGWLPQVNTLAHHVLEQIEMHVFGGTASLGVSSALLQVMKSCTAWALLTAICHAGQQLSPASTQSPAFSAFLAVSVGTSYLLSRFSSNPQLARMLLDSMWDRVRSVEAAGSSGSTNTAGGRRERAKEEESTSMTDPLPASLRKTVSLRARHDFLFATFISLAVFALHSTSVFTATRPYFMLVIVPLCFCTGIFNHYIYLQLRTHTPWKLISKPLLRSGEFSNFECVSEAKLMAFERFYVWLQAIERNILYPLLAVCLLCDSAWSLPWSPLTSSLFAIRIIRGGFSHPQLLFVPLILSFIATRWDWAHHLPFGLEDSIPAPALFTISFVLCVMVYPKWLELYLKINFIMAYVAPWQISWGSAFHAFAQPFSVPHSALILAQTVVSSILSAPLNPFLGSSFFMTSYVRPVKFWERDYNTKRSDASNTRLASQIDRGPMLDDSNLNAVFYEHLTRSLQKSLAGDLQMGRWATSVEPGDCFILASFYLNCLVHIVEVGNGFVTFQLRGLEFRGTYCHQREVEAISEDQSEGAGFCCCSPGSLPGFLSLNTAWSLRWLAWEVVAAKYVIEGYSITDNSAVNLLQVHELRRLLITLYVKCIIFYATTSTKLSAWLSNETVLASLQPILDNPRYADVDHVFCAINDEDYDASEAGISRSSFSDCYLAWIKHCLSKRVESTPDETFDTKSVVGLCYVLSLLGRRALGTASNNRHSTVAESFLYALHALFKGDFRIQCQRDEWVFADMDLLRCVISPAVKMALKLHQDHFAATDDFDDSHALYSLIADHQTKLFISHEQDPAWRNAILSNTESLLALRHVYDDGQDDYKIIMLNKMHLDMRVIKLNRECVRAFWAGQQQELIFLRNRNPERGSIQNARQVLRNMINSSADQPVGYPIYVSPLTTSYVDTHAQMKRVVGTPITIEGIGSTCLRVWRSLCWYLGPSTSSSLNQPGGCPPNGPHPVVPSTRDPTNTAEDRTSQLSGQAEQSVVQMTPDGGARVSLARKASGEKETQVGRKKTGHTAGSSAGGKTGSIDRAISEEGLDSETTQGEKGVEWESEMWIEITDVEHVFKYLDEPLKSTGQPLVEWPSLEIRRMASHKLWSVQPTVGMRGHVVYTWYPNHPNRKMRSHIGSKIYLVAVAEMCDILISIGEQGCREMTIKEVSKQEKKEKRENMAESSSEVYDSDSTGVVDSEVISTEEVTK